MDLHHLTATQALELFVSRELSPVELLDACVRRTEQVESTVNALTEELLFDAYVAAREAERRYAGQGPSPRALEGLPLVLKEEQAIAGKTLEEGSLLLRGHLAQVTHPVVERVLAAGAVVHARSATPEFSCAPVTHSRLWGVTRNPWNPAMSPGGSSGGAAAALAAGETLLATGSDIGGSIRLPASFCGLVGFKPPFGRVPGLAPFNADTYCADGPLARSVGDAALLQNVLAGPHWADPVSLRPAYRIPVAPQASDSVRVALCVSLGDYDVDPVVEANTRAAGDALRSKGVTVEEVTLPWTRQQISDAAWAHYGAVLGAAIGTVVGERAQDLMTYTVDFAERSAAAASYAEGLLAEATIYEPLGALLDSYDALLCPTVATTGFPADAGAQAPYDWGDALMTVPFNIAGRLPVLALPSGVAPNGIPTGVQLVGRPYDDATVFGLGTALEQALAMWTSPDWWPTP
jgi:aspartyl-tRNA(Asn)/glutamyl-tRNA(Gln) amidotransferase subunit A